MSKKVSTGLGRGLDSLLGGGKVAHPSAKTEVINHLPSITSTSDIPIENIVPNPLQPRTDFDKQKLEELAQSIKLLGVIQPITVSRLSVGKYQIISGERRFRASKLAGCKTIPAYIKKDLEDTDGAKLELALVENVQRDDLNPIEIALSLKRLAEECNLTQEALSERVGINRATIANYIRLLKLPPAIQLALKKEAITMGHAKAVLALANENSMVKVANRIIEEDLSVRQTEDLVKRINGSNNPSPEGKPRSKDGSASSPSEYGVQIGDILSKYFSSKIKISSTSKGSGSVLIKYKNEKELQKFLEVLKNHKL